MLVEKGRSGETVKLALDAEVSVLAAGEGEEPQVIVLFGADEHSLPVGLAEVLEEHFGSRKPGEADADPRYYGPMRIIIERR